MGRFTALFLAAALAFSSGEALAKRVDAPRAVRDATSRASESVMTSNIDKARGTVPLGTIVAYPNFGGLSEYVSGDYVECDGRPIPADTDIYRKGIRRTPNLYAGNNGRGYFLRANPTPQSVSPDLLRSHNHDQPAHAHEWSGALSSTAVSGKADGQKFQDHHTGVWTSPSAPSGTPWPEAAVFGPMPLDFDVGVTCSAEGGCSASASVNMRSQAYAFGAQSPNQAEKSDVTAKVNNGTVDGIVYEAGDDPTYYTAMRGNDTASATTQDRNSETAPTFYTTRYFMRVNE